MGLYEKYVFPWILEQIEGPEIRAMRQACVAPAQGDVLEIGLGTGKTIPEYGPAVRSLSAVEPNIGMRKRLDERIASASFPIDLVESAGESLPYQDDQFDSVVVSLVLCSVREPTAVIAEIRRVLKPGGTFHFFEHVANDDPSVRRWQNRMNWLQRIVGCGCNLNRDTRQAIEAGGFEITSMERCITTDISSVPHWFPFIFGHAKKI